MRFGSVSPTALLRAPDTGSQGSGGDPAGADGGDAAASPGGAGEIDLDNPAIKAILAREVARHTADLKAHADKALREKANFAEALKRFEGVSEDDLAAVREMHQKREEERTEQIKQKGEWQKLIDETNTRWETKFSKREQELLEALSHRDTTLSSVIKNQALADARSKLNIKPSLHLGFDGRWERHIKIVGDNGSLPQAVVEVDGVDVPFVKYVTEGWAKSDEAADYILAPTPLQGTGARSPGGRSSMTIDQISRLSQPEYEKLRAAGQI